MPPAAIIEPFHVRDAFDLPRDAGPVIARASREDSYPIHVTRCWPETLARLGELLEGSGVALITDDQVARLHARPLLEGLGELGCDVIVRAVPAGEASKCLEQAVRLWHWLAESSLARRDAVVTFGGGVINDLGGWVASAYMRGVPYVNVPTTLLAQVDGALGGKVAVNHAVAKNLLGAFYQPAGVVSDVSLLRSLPARHLRAGLAECIKKAMIASPAYWALIERDADRLLARDLAALERLVRAAAAIKSALIERDPYEADLRRPLNFGHTMGHPIETVTGYGAVLHGEAVALGMVVEARIAAARGLLEPALLERLIALLERCGLPTGAAWLPARMTADDVVAAMGKVRLIRAGSLRYVLPVALGETVIADDVSEAEARAALAACGIE
jgi:3-dehydroquinate synthase